MRDLNNRLKKVEVIRKRKELTASEFYSAKMFRYCTTEELYKIIGLDELNAFIKEDGGGLKAEKVNSKEYKIFWQYIESLLRKYARQIDEYKFSDMAIEILKRRRDKLPEDRKKSNIELDGKVFDIVQDELRRRDAKAKNKIN